MVYGAASSIHQREQSSHLIGIDLDGNKDVLGMWIGENESAKFWLSVLNDLKNRGVQDMLITCVDNLIRSLVQAFWLFQLYNGTSADLSSFVEKPYHMVYLRTSFPFQALSPPWRWARP